MSVNNDEFFDQSVVEVLLEKLTYLNERLLKGNSLDCITKTEYDQLYGQFKLLDRNIFDHKNFSIDSNDRLEELVDIMASIADLDFSTEATVKNEFNHLDYIAISINLMRERLEERVAYFKNFRSVLDSFDDLHLITDLNGLILYSNGALADKLKVQPKDVIGQHVKSFFDGIIRKKEFSLDFIRAFGIHGIDQEFIENKTSQIVLKVSGKAYLSDGKREIGYCYKVEPMIKALYSNSIRHSAKNQVQSTFEQLDQLTKTQMQNQEQQEVLREIAQTYADKTNLNFMEIMILNSVNQLLDRTN